MNEESVHSVKLSWRSIVILTVLGLLLGWLTLFRGYNEPRAFFWDENYHIASAQKYLNHVFFQEPHPPLGKLLIAAGEYLVDANSDDSQYLNTNHADNLPSDFSFAGYRFFPALLAALTVPLFGILGAQLSRSLIGGLICLCAFGIDNALVVHLRGAMLEGPQLFFLIGSAVAALGSSPIVAGLCAGAAMATKINSAPTLVLVTLAIFHATKIKGVVRFATMALLIWAAVWQTHFTLGQKLVEDKYKASTEYQEAIKQGQAGSLKLFFPALKQSLAFYSDYQTGVPPLNMCKGQENGSYPLLWPLGSQSINYRWERKDSLTRYTYLQINPAIWLFSLLGILWAFREWSLAPLKPSVCLALIALYAAGIGLPLLYDRVFYLYHFFISLLAGVIAGAIWLGKVESRTQREGWIIASVLILIFATTFRFFAPLTYGMPLTDAQLEKRQWIPLWNLRCANCNSIYPIARPDSDGANPIAISGRKATSVTQGWGVTRMGLTDEMAPLIIAGRIFHFGIGTHANGEMNFPIPSYVSTFSAFAGVPDSYRGRKTTIQFIVLADGAEVFRTPVMHPGDPAIPMSVPLFGKKELTLKITDAGDGNTDDHGAWLEPVFN